jgi:hypothetical protein
VSKASVPSQARPIRLGGNRKTGALPTGASLVLESKSGEGRSGFCRRLQSTPSKHFLTKIHHLQWRLAARPSTRPVPILPPPSLQAGISPLVSQFHCRNSNSDG